MFEEPIRFARLFVGRKSGIGNAARTERGQQSAELTNALI